MYSKILKDPTLLRLSLVQLFAYFGAWFSNVALYTLILEFHVDPITNAIVVSMYALPALFGPLLGAIVDKFDFKRFMLSMLGIELIMTALYLTIQDISQVPLLMLFIFIKSTASLLFFQSEMSLLPQIVPKELLKSANELHSIIWSVTFAAGMALGGLFVAHLGIKITIMIDMGLFSIAIFLFSTLPLHLTPKSTNSIKQLIQEGFSYLKAHKGLMHLIMIHAAVALTSFDALINLLTDISYKEIISIPLAIGWLNATRALGLMIGPLIIRDKVSLETLHLFLLAQGIVIVLWAFVEHHFWISLGMMFTIGFFTTTLWSYTYTLIQTHTESEFLGRVVAYNDMIFMLVSVVTTLFIGMAYKLGLSVEGITATIGLGFFAASGYYLWYRKNYRDFLESKSNE